MKDLFIENMPSHIENWLQQKPFRELTAMQQREVLIYMSATGYDETHELIQDTTGYLCKDIPGLRPDDRLRGQLQTLTAARRKRSFASNIKAAIEQFTRVLRHPVPAYQVATAFGVLILTVLVFTGIKPAGPESAERVFVHDTLYIDNAANGSETLAVADSHNILLQHAGLQSSQAVNKGKIKAAYIDQMDTDAIMRGELSPASSHRENKLDKPSNKRPEGLDSFTEDTGMQPIMHPRL